MMTHILLDASENNEYLEPLKYTLDLQLFAGDDKTEQATPKRKEEARKRGQVLQSPEVSAAIVLAVAFLSFKLFGSFIYGNISDFTQKALSVYMSSAKADSLFFNDAAFKALFVEMLIVFVKVAFPIIGAILVAGLAVNYAQVGFLFTTESLAFNIDKIINPFVGLQRMFSAKAFADLVKSIVKIIIVCAVAYWYIQGEIDDILNIMDLAAVSILGYFGVFAFNVGIRISVTLIILGLFDYLFQWWQFEKSLRMSKQEVKDEYKQTEGNPQIKSKIREKQRAISMQRMMQDVPKADVVITNPTHFAVAIKYETNVSSAPIVIAKGQDFVAQRIKEVARENKVEIVENKPLARTLYSSVEIGESIPPELYQAVAEVLAFVFSLKEGRK